MTRVSALRVGDIPDTAPISLAASGLVENIASTGLTVNLPAVAANQVAVVTLGASSVAVTAPAGWTLIGSQTDPATLLMSAAWYRVGVGASGSHTWSGLLSGRHGAYWQVFDAVDLVTPVDVAIVTTLTSSANQATVPTMTPATRGALLVQAATLNASAANDLLVPPGMSRMNSSTGTGRRHVVAAQSLGPIEATGTRVWTDVPADPLVFAVISFILRPRHPGAFGTVGGPLPAPDHGQLLWSDEFNGSSGDPLDASKWSYEYNTGPATDGGTFNGRPGDLQWYANDDRLTAALDGQGAGRLTVVSEPAGGYDYTSASIHTKGKYSFTYGFIEVRVKTPSGSGLAPMVWTEGITGTWPGRGQLDLVNQIDSDNGNTMNVYGGPSLWQEPVYWSDPPKDPNTWHVYGARIGPGKIEFYLDNALVHTVTVDDMPVGQTWPYDTVPQFIRLNLAMRGTPDLTASLPASMMVDYVRVYEYRSSATPADGLGITDLVSAVKSGAGNAPPSTITIADFASVVKLANLTAPPSTIAVSDTVAVALVDQRRSLVIGVDRPDNPANAGLLPGWTKGMLTVWNGDYLLDTPGETVSNLLINGKLKVTASGCRARNLWVQGPAVPGNSNQHLVTHESAGTTDFIIEDSVMIPQTPTYGWNAIKGHHYTAKRCIMQLTVDGVRVYDATAGQQGLAVGVAVEQCWIGQLTLFSPDPNHPPATSDNRTHNDISQMEGGRGTAFRGNVLDGRLARTWPGINLSTSDPTTNPPNVFAPPTTFPYYTGSGGEYPTTSILQIIPSVGSVGDLVVEDNWFYYGVVAVNFANPTGSAQALHGKAFTSFKRNKYNHFQGSGGGATSTTGHCCDIGAAWVNPRGDSGLDDTGAWTGQQSYRDTDGNVYEDTGTPIIVRYNLHGN